MKSKDKRELMKECTNKMSIDIDNIPKDICIELTEVIGNILLRFGLEFEYSGIGEGFSDNICGIQFDVKDTD
ncbi:conserved hypothetical protein [Clostridium neonatale]|uniref:hypothetical protein n=1 Tax=Clostridium neonatale TaxID=137838 RepID=UPI00291B36BA|nr:hypothetical protein [Clostridium neonatale]CAI3242240.1 conserved hypothetical protein [Clostridium neonatale]